MGFTLIEVVVALAIAGVALMAIVPVFVSNLTVNTRSEVRSQAAVAAQQTFDQLRLKNTSEIPTSGSEDNTVTVGGRQLTVRKLYCQTAGYCPGSSRQVTVQVFQGTTQVFSAETIFTQVNDETK